jgi:hypothetical protein
MWVKCREDEQNERSLRIEDDSHQAHEDYATVNVTVLF